MVNTRSQTRRARAGSSPPQIGLSQSEARYPDLHAPSDPAHVEGFAPAHSLPRTPAGDTQATVRGTIGRPPNQPESLTSPVITLTPPTVQQQAATSLPNNNANTALTPSSSPVNIRTTNAAKRVGSYLTQVPQFIHDILLPTNVPQQQQQNQVDQAPHQAPPRRNQDAPLFHSIQSPSSFAQSPANVATVSKSDMRDAMRAVALVVDSELNRGLRVFTGITDTRTAAYFKRQLLKLSDENGWSSIEQFFALLRLLAPSVKDVVCPKVPATPTDQAFTTEVDRIVTLLYSRFSRLGESASIENQFCNIRIRRDEMMSQFINSFTKLRQEYSNITGEVITDDRAKSKLLFALSSIVWTQQVILSNRRMLSFDDICDELVATEKLLSQQRIKPTFEKTHQRRSTNSANSTNAVTTVDVNAASSTSFAAKGFTKRDGAIVCSRCHNASCSGSIKCCNEIADINSRCSKCGYRVPKDKQHQCKHS